MTDPQLTHPGTITFVDGATDLVTHTVKASEVPLELRFAPSGEESALVPVVKVIAFQEGNRRIIREYGPDETELRSTVQLRRQP